MKHLKERFMGACYTAAGGVLILMLTLLLGEGMEKTLDLHFLAIAMFFPLITALLGFFLGYKILLLPKDKKHWKKAVTYGVIMGFLALFIVDVIFLITINTLTYMHCSSHPIPDCKEAFGFPSLFFGIIGMTFVVSIISVGWIGILLAGLGALILYWYRCQ